MISRVYLLYYILLFAMKKDIIMKTLTKYNIPKNFGFRIHKAEEGGYWLDSKDLPGLYTQGDTLSELFENLEDAVLTYFDVPRSKAKKVYGFINIDVNGLVNLGETRLNQPVLVR